MLASAPRLESTELAKGAPAYAGLPRPLVVKQATRALETDLGTFQAEIRAHVHGIGAVGVQVRIPFELPDLAAVNALTFLRVASGPGVELVAREVAEDVRRAIEPALVETYAASVEPEPYLVIVLTECNETTAELLRQRRQLLAGVVAGERTPERLAPEEVEDNLRHWYRYHEDDLVIIDWERALVVEPSGKYEDTLRVMETANLELLELRTYDRYLDEILEDAYEDLTRFYGRGGLFRSARDVQSALSDARIDLVRVTDGINNIGKIFGDYYLAKLHMGLAGRLHLHEWEKIVREKMATLNDLYTMASHEVEHRRGVVLESMIVLLFVIDLAVIVLVSR